MAGTISQEIQRIKNEVEQQANKIAMLSEILESKTSGDGLPSGFTRLSFIESHGSEYIDTEFVPNQDTSVIMDVQIVSVISSLVANTFYGSRVSASSYVFATHYTTASDKITHFFNNGYEQTTPNNLLSRQLLVANKNTLAYANIVSSRSYTSFKCKHPMFLLATNSAGSATWFGNFRLYSCRIYDGENLIRDYVPCTRTADGHIGLYDMVQKKFVGNSGTGSFTGG